MSKQESSKQAHEIGCLKAAQESLVGFPQGEIRLGGDPPDCCVVAPNRGDVAFELTEQVDQIATEATAHAKHFVEEARDEFFRKHPEHRTGWRISVSPGDIFETIAAEPDSTSAWVGREKNLIDRFVSAVAGELVERHSFEWRVPSEPIWTFDTRERIHPQELTSIVFQVGGKYCLKSRHRIENVFGRDVTFKPEDIQARITKKVSGLERYKCRPAYVLISASLFPRSVRSAGSFAVLKTPQSILDHLFDIGEFTAVFLHDIDNRSYRIWEDGRAVELQRRSLSTATSGRSSAARGTSGHG